MSQPVGLWRLKYSERRIILLLGDVLIAFISLMLAVFLWGEQDWLNNTPEFFKTRVFSSPWLFIVAVIWVLLLLEIYDLRRAARTVDILKGVATASGVSIGCYILIFFLAEPNSLPRLAVGYFIIIAAVLTICWRLLFANLFTAPIFTRRVLIVGAGRAGSVLADIVHKMQPRPYHVIGLVDDDPSKIGTIVGGYPVIGNGDMIMDLIQQYHITDLVFSIIGEMRPEMFQIVLQAEEAGVEVRTMPAIYEELLGKIPVSLLNADWILRSFVDTAHTSDFYEISKRMVDIVGACMGLVVLVLLLPIVSLIILIDSGSPIFYYQTRAGRNGRTYKIIKFRTMVVDAEKEGCPQFTTRNDSRITRVGRFLRKTHVDEFPQFINVLKGDLSLVGPRTERPEVISQLQNKIPFYRARQLVRPGLTGWAQIHQRYASTTDDMVEKLEYDLYYIKHRSLSLDFVILLRTTGLIFGFGGQ